MSDSTYRNDRRVTIPRHAGAGIPESWIVNLNSLFIEVFRDVRSTDYNSATRYTRNGPVTPLLLPQVRLTLSDLLQRRATPRSR